MGAHGARQILDLHKYFLSFDRNALLLLTALELVGARVDLIGRADLASEMPDLSTSMIRGAAASRFLFDIAGSTTQTRSPDYASIYSKEMASSDSFFGVNR